MNAKFEKLVLQTDMQQTIIGIALGSTAVRARILTLESSGLI
jgi:hypothetical protein